MMRALILVAALALGLGGCQTIPTAVELATTSICEGQTVDEQRRWDAEAAYNATATAYLAANKSGLLSPSLKASLKPKVILMYEGLKGVRLAHKACDAASLQAKVAALLALRDQVMPLIPKTS